jgi:hypothetical protein
MGDQIIAKPFVTLKRMQHCKITGYIFAAREENHVKPQMLWFEHGTITAFSYRPIFRPKYSTPLNSLMACDLNLSWWGILKVWSSKYEAI